MTVHFLFWGCLLVMFGVTLVVMYAFAERLYGTASARRQARLLGPYLFGALVLTLLIYQLIAVAWPVGTWGIIQFVLALIICISGIVRWQRRRQAGALLLKVGRTQLDRWMLIGGVFIIVAGLFSGLTASYGAATAATDVMYVLLQLSLGFNILLEGLVGTELREGGIWHNRLIPWQRIKGYWWESDKPNVLTLQVEARLSPQRQQSFPVPPDNQQTIEALLEQRLSDAAASGATLLSP